MLRKFELDTSGVLLVVAKSALKAAFATTPFNYDFPEGLLPLISSGGLLAVVTESGEEVKGRLLIDASTENTAGFTLLATQKFYAAADDEIVVLSHSEFTQIADWHKGDMDAYAFRDKKIALSKPENAWYIAKIYSKQPKNSYFLHFIVEMTSETTEPAMENSDDVVRF
jgi:hypothetical protein